MRHPHSGAGGASDSLPIWSLLLTEAVIKPGLVMQAYAAFHNYSIGNQILALVQCHRRGIRPGPINTFPGWLGLNRHVRKGERALLLCTPITRKRRDESARGDDTETYTSFVYKPRWFVLSQTEGEEVPTPELPGFDEERALAALGITRIPFDDTNGNVQGYARRREVAVSPVAQLPAKTFFHETAHVVLGHTAEGDFTDTETTPRNLREVEAEAVALLCCESLGLEGADFCRGYIQRWLAGGEIPEGSARKIFRAADQILRAGREGGETAD